MYSVAGDRRDFLKCAGIITVGAALTGIPAAAKGYPELRIKLLAEAIVPTSAVIAPGPPASFGPFEVRARQTCPAILPGEAEPRRDVMSVHVYLMLPSSDLPLAEAPDPGAAMPMTASLFYVRLDEIRLSNVIRTYPFPDPEHLREFPYQLALLGEVIAHPVVPPGPPFGPFGDQTGRAVLFSAAFDQPGPATTFQMFGGSAAGDHTTMAPGLPDALRPNGTALGSLEIFGPNGEPAVYR